MTLDRRPLVIISMHSCPFSEIGGRENGGMSVYIREVAREHAARGIETHIFTRRDDPGAPQDLDVPDECTLHHVVAGPQAPLDKDELFFHLPEFLQSVSRHMREHAIDPAVIHSHYWLSGWTGRRLGQLWGVPWLHSAHTLALVKDRDRPPGGAPESAVRISVEQEIVRDCNRLVSPTAQEVEDLAILYGTGRDCIAIVPPGVDLQTFSPGPDDGVRAELGLPERADLVLFIGRLERLKGLDTALHALATLARTGPAPALVVIGADSGTGVHEAGLYGGERARLEALARELGVEESVHFLGAVGHQRLARYYRAADVCVVPSYNESFGLVALESLACGTPVVASRVGGLRQLVLDGITGFTVNSHDPKEYASRLDELLRDPALRKGMGVAGRRLAQAYPWRRTADQLLHTYEEAQQDYARAAESALGLG